MTRQKMVFLIWIVPVLVFLSSCKTTTASFTEEERNKALSVVMSFFENSQERVFTILEPVEADGNDCLAIEVLGKYDQGTYLLDSFAFRPQSDSWYYKTPSGDYERFQNTPWYAYSVSPDKKFCMESMNINDGGHGGGGVFCKCFLQKVASNFSIVLQLHFP